MYIIDFVGEGKTIYIYNKNFKNFMVSISQLNISTLNIIFII